MEFVISVKIFCLSFQIKSKLIQSDFQFCVLKPKHFNQFFFFQFLFFATVSDSCTVYASQEQAHSI